MYQNIDIIEGYNPEYIVILAGDHVYKMDYAVMLTAARRTRARTSRSAASKCRAMEATAFGVMHVDDISDRIIAFVEKPADPPAIPGTVRT